MAALNEEQFRAQFRRQPEEDIPHPGPVPEWDEAKDVPKFVYRQGTDEGGQGTLFGVRSEGRREAIAEDRNYKKRVEYNRRNAPYRAAQRELGDKGVGLPGNLGSWDINDFTAPREVRSHGDYHIAKFQTGIAAFQGDQVVGRLQPSYNAVHLIEVKREHRRKGVATAMFRLAQELYGPTFRHGYKRTTEGDIWARTIGGPGL